MNQSLSSTLSLVIEAAWRRRLILILPFVVILPLGLTYAKFGPKTYVAKSLLLLQERGRDNPLSRDLRDADRIYDRVAGLEALLTSDRVLYSVMSDIADGETLNDPKKAAAWVQGLSKSLTLELLGTDFLEFQLKGNSPGGLGKELEAVVWRFLEALLPAQHSLSAMQEVLVLHREELEAAERRYAQVKEQADHLLPATYRSDVAQLEDQLQQLAQRKKELAAVSGDLENLRPKAGGKQSGLLEWIAQVSFGKEAPAGQVDAGQSGSLDMQTSAQQLAEGGTVQETEARYVSLKDEVEQLEKSVADTQRMIRDYGPLADQLQELETEVQQAREDYRVYAERYTKPAGGIAPGILAAPERIKVIDAPSDPEIPTNAASKIALASVVASILVAVGLAFVTELLDPSVRRPEQLEELTGVPVLARLP